MKDLIRVLKFSKPYWRYTALVGVMIIFTLANRQISPWIYKMVTDQIVAGVENQTPATEALQAVLPALVGFLGLSIVSSIAGRIRERSGNWLAINMKAHLMKKAFSHLTRLHTGYFDQETSGRIMSKLDRGVNRIVGITYAIANHFVPNLLSGLISIAIIAFIRLEIALFLIAAMIPYVVISIWVLKKHKRQEKEYNKMYDDNYSHFYEAVSSIRLIKGFVKEDFEKTKLKKFFDQIYQIEIKFQKMWDIAAIKDVMLSILNWLIYLYVIRLTFSGEFTIGTFFLLHQYIQLAQQPVLQLAWMFFDIKRAMTGAEDYLKILDAKPEIEDDPNAKELNFTAGEIEFRKVSFRYKKGQEVFKNFNLKVKPGETIAFVGKSGVGKTTIANLLTRFNDPQEGEILIDGQNIAKVTQESLRKRVGTVMQESYLFALSIKENLLYGDENLTEERMIKACKAANAHEFIEKLPERYETKLGDRGVKLSGGQKQRLSIARTLLKNPPILILDEATSALDSESEAKVQEAIWRLVENRTTLIIAHRLSTIQKADRIVVLGAGGILEQGSHQALLKHDGIYAKLYELQSGKKKSELLEEYELN